MTMLAEEVAESGLISCRHGEVCGSQGGRGVVVFQELRAREATESGFVYDQHGEACKGNLVVFEALLTRYCS